MSKGQPYLAALSYLTLKGQLQWLFLFLPFLGGGNRGHPKVGSPPSSTRGVGGERAGWVLPCPPSFQRAGGGGGLETTLTQDNLSYVLSSTNIKRYIPKATTFLIAMMDSPFFPSFPSPLNRKLSLAISPVSRSVIYLNHSRGPVVVPVGTRTGDSRIHVSLSNRGGPIKVPGVVKSRKQNGNPERVTPIT